jgi:integrase
VPTTPIVIDQLNRLKALNGNEFLFSDDGGATPITRYMFNQALSSGLSKIGIDETEKKQRNLTPHAWRHFFNTTLRANNVSDAKAQSIIGHATQSMTEHYTHFDTLAFAEVKDIQDNILLQEPVKQIEAACGDDTGEMAHKPIRARRYVAVGRHEARRALIVQRKKHRHG